MALEDVAGQDLRIVGPDGVDEVLVVRELHRRQSLRFRLLRARLVGRARPLLVLRADFAHVRLPLPAALLDPEPALRAVEDVTDADAAFVVGVLAARAEL